MGLVVPAPFAFEEASSLIICLKSQNYSSQNLEVICSSNCSGGLRSSVMPSSLTQVSRKGDLGMQTSIYTIKRHRNLEQPQCLIKPSLLLLSQLRDVPSTDMCFNKKLLKVRY